MAWLDCPHGCGAKRQTSETMQEHIDSQHSDVRVAPRGPIIAPGEAVAPSELIEELERMETVSRELVEVTPINDEMIMRQQRDSGLWLNGKLIPEFITAWRPDGMQVKVHAKRMWEVMRKGFTFRRPVQAQIDEVWFHWRCPLRSCPSHNNICELHGEPGDDSNHHLKSSEYMIIDHLRSGGKVHRQFFEMHKDEFRERYKSAWLAWEAQEVESAALTERQRQEHEKTMAASAGRNAE